MAKAKSTNSKKARKPLRISVHGESIDLELRLDTTASAGEFEDLLRKISASLPCTPPIVEGSPSPSMAGVDRTLVIDFVKANAESLSDDTLAAVIELLNEVKTRRSESPPVS
jgi:hypothetical protein